MANQQQVATGASTERSRRTRSSIPSIAEVGSIAQPSADAQTSIPTATVVDSEYGSADQAAAVLATAAYGVRRDDADGCLTQADGIADRSTK